MIYVIDTHALVWYLEGDNKLGPKAREDHARGEQRLIIPRSFLRKSDTFFQRKN